MWLLISAALLEFGGFLYLPAASFNRIKRKAYFLLGHPVYIYNTGPSLQFRVLVPEMFE